MSAPTTPTTAQVTIPAQNLATMEAKLTKLGKRAAKLGIEPPRWIAGDPYEVPAGKDAFGRDRVIVRVDITVSMQPVKLAGWEFVGTIEHTDEGNIVRAVPGYQGDLKRFRHTGRNCDHCKLDRRRNDTYIVVHDVAPGGEVQVGSSCLADFVGHMGRDPVAVVEMLRTLWEFVGSVEDDEEYGSGSAGENACSLGEYLAVVSATVRAHGWLPKGKAWEQGRSDQATAPVAWERIFDRKAKEIPYLWAIQVEDGDLTLANQAATWAADLPEDTDNDYLWNLRVACRQDYVTYRRTGIVASAIVAYQRKLAKDEEKRAAADSEFMGEVKGKVTADVTVVMTRWIETAYGGSMLVKMVTPEGNRLTWFASNPPDCVEIGAHLTVTGTVKDHKEFAGAKETNLTRCKVTAA